jgi:N-methylhydantoinase B/oxoprolinase/acetone carboxylase alpha subunit
MTTTDLTAPETTTTTAQVTITVAVDGVTKTFTGSSTTDGSPGNAVRGVLNAVASAATTWTFRPLQEALR